MAMIPTDPAQSQKVLSSNAFLAYASRAIPPKTPRPLRIRATPVPRVGRWPRQEAGLCSLGQRLKDHRSNRWVMACQRLAQGSICYAILRIAW